MEISIRELGAVPDGKTLNTEVIQRAIDICSEQGGRVTVSGGVYMTGKIMMKSNVELYIEAGATLLGSPDYADYPETENVTHVDSKMLPRERNACLIFAECCENIALTGMGKIDCNGDSFVVPLDRPVGPHRVTFQRIPTLTPPRAVFFTGCKNVRIENVTMVNQPAGWSYWIHDCAFVNVDKIKILADLRYPNNDGVHINCSHDVTVSNCLIVCSDDCIVVRANSISLKENKPCERVCVTNCALTSYACGVRIGWMNDGVIRSCAFSNLVITGSRFGIGMHLPYRIRESGNVRILDAKRPISTDVGREQTLIESISFDNVIMDGIYSRPIDIKIEDHESIGCRGIRNIRFSSVHATALAYPSFKGRKQDPLGDVYLYNCTFTRLDEIDGEARVGGDLVTEHAERVHLVNTEML